MIPLYKNVALVGETRKKILRRAQADIDALFDDVKYWVQKVKNEGDSALLEYIQKFDDPHFSLDRLRVTPAEIEEAYNRVSPEVIEILKKQISISQAFHAEQARHIFDRGEWEIETIPGVRTGAKITPLDSVGLYVPAGKAPLPTVAQILTVAAKAARVPRVAVFFPPTGDYPEILIAAHIAGSDEIYRVGGIAAISAMAYGTESIIPVEKISGPGSPWVQAAKLQVFGQVGIDMLAGPSEGLILADETSNPEYCALDILARCEHGPDSSMVLCCTSQKIAEETQKKVEELKQECSRRGILEQSLYNGYTALIVVDSREEMIAFANEYGAEHLEIQTKDAEELSKSIRNAGSIFIGEYAPVPVGDYASGTNHSLPTARAVKFSSPVGVETFVKTVEKQILTKEGLQNLSSIVQTVSKIEGLDAHGRAVSRRLSS